MSIFNESTDQQHIVQKYFSDPEKKVMLNKGDILIKQGEINKRLFYVKKGRLSGFLPDEHIAEPVFEAQPGSFVGVYSFFSEDHKSYSEVIATKSSEIYYLESNPEGFLNSGSTDLLGFLFNIVVLELRSRQHFAAKMANDRQEVLNKMIQTEKLVTLGQLAAGLAHELNNTIGSFISNLGQLESDIEEMIQENSELRRKYGYFQKGKEKGIALSSSEERELRKSWPKSSGLDTSTIKKLIRAGISYKEIKGVKDAESDARLWNIGHILHDLTIASKQATHVVNSIKTLGIANQQWSASVKVNDTIKDALAIMRSSAKYAELQLILDESIPPIEACHGELVQVWVNLIKNAIENLRQFRIPDPKVTIQSLNKENSIVVKIEDNGTGIDESIMSRIFEPNFTTKVEGLSLGLGVGLTIVQRIITEHFGTVKIKSKPGKTTFTITFTKKNSHE